VICGLTLTVRTVKPPRIALHERYKAMCARAILRYLGTPASHNAT